MLLSLLLLLLELLFFSPRRSHNGAQNGSPNNQEKVSNVTKMAPKMIKMSSRRPPGTPWAPGGYQDAIEIGPGALLEASGGEKNSLVPAGGPPEKFLDHFSTS